MTDDDRAQFFASVMRHEGFSPRATPDSRGSFVIGYGWNLQYGPPITVSEAKWLLEQQTAAIERELEIAWPPYTTCDGPRQRLLLELAYQLGVGGLLTFVHFLHAVAVRDFQTADTELMNSNLARQVPSRAQDYRAMLHE